MLNRRCLTHNINLECQETFRIRSFQIKIPSTYYITVIMEKEKNYLVNSNYYFWISPFNKFKVFSLIVRMELNGQTTLIIAVKLMENLFIGKRSLFTWIKNHWNNKFPISGKKILWIIRHYRKAGNIWNNTLTKWIYFSQ